MNEHHITLIGGEVAPVIIGYLASPAPSVHIVYTPETQASAMLLRNFFDNRGAKEIAFVPTDAFSPAAIYAVADKLFKTLDVDKSVLNYTGGTKQMSIGFFSAAIKHRVNCIYVDSQNVNITALNNGKWSVTPHPKVDISILEWLQVRGFQDVEMQDVEAYKPYEELTDWIFKTGDKHLKPIREISDYAQDLLTKSERNNSIPHWEKAFVHDDLIVTPEDNCKKVSVEFKGSSFGEKNRQWWIHFFAYNWFEFWVYKILRATGAYDEIFMNVQIYKSGGKAKRQVYNEIDVVAIKDGYLHFIDAKLGYLDMKSITKMRTDRQLYASKYSKMVFVSWFPVNKISSSRSKDLDIEVIIGPDAIISDLKTHHRKFQRNKSL